MKSIPLILYDFLCYLLPGFILLGPWLLDSSLRPKAEAADTVTWIYWGTIAYVLGHICDHVCHCILQDGIVEACLGDPKYWLLTSPRKLSSSSTSSLPTCSTSTTSSLTSSSLSQSKNKCDFSKWMWSTLKSLAVVLRRHDALDQPTHNALKARLQRPLVYPSTNKDEAWAVYRHCLGKISSTEHLLERIDRLQSMYSFCRNVSGALFFAGVVLLCCRPGIAWIPFVTSVVVFIRYLALFRLHAKEVFRVYAWQQT